MKAPQEEEETPVAMDGVVATPPGLGEKRPRDQEFVDAEDNPPTPTEMPEAEPVREQAPRKELTLQDIMDTMTKGFSRQELGMTSMRREMGELQRETGEAKGLAAKAVTIADETKESLTTLEKRVAALESGPPPHTQYAKSRATSSHKGAAPRDFDQLGGDDGDTLIIGGFRNWADREERKTEWDLIEPQLPPPLREAVSEIIVPNSQCQIIILKIHQDPRGPRETRQKMFEWAKKFRALELTYKAPDETNPRTYYAQPSKPFEMRQRNAKTMGMLDGFKALLGAEKADKLKPDLSNGRIFFERLLLAERAPGNDTPSPRMTAVNQILPDVTREQVYDSMKNAMDQREKARKGP